MKDGEVALSSHQEGQRPLLWGPTSIENVSSLLSSLQKDESNRKSRVFEVPQGRVVRHSMVLRQCLVDNQCGSILIR